MKDINSKILEFLNSSPTKAQKLFENFINNNTKSTMKININREDANRMD